MENSLGTRIKELISKRNLSVAKVERIADLKSGTIRSIIIGKSKNPTHNTLIKICNALECSLSSLIYDEVAIQEPSFLRGLSSSSDKEWDVELFKKSTETVEKYLNKHQLSFKLNKVLSLIIDLYLYSLTKNNKQIDEKSAEWLIEKLKVNLTIKIED